MRRLSVSDNTIARTFLDALPVFTSNRLKIAHGNAGRMLELPAAVPKPLQTGAADPREQP